MKAQKRLDEAALAFQQAINLRKRLVELDPSQPDYTRMLANSYMNIGLVEKDRGVVEESHRGDGEVYFQKARRMIEEAQSLRRQLLNRPGGDELKTNRDLALGHYNLANRPLSLLGSEEGRRHADDAIKYFEQVRAKNPRDLTNEQRLIQSYRLAAEHARAADDLAEAQKWLTGALERAEPLALTNASVPQYQHELARLLISRGQVSDESDNLVAALGDFEAPDRFWKNS